LAAKTADLIDCLANIVCDRSIYILQG
jgi:hypothetical protein